MQFTLTFLQMFFIGLYLAAPLMLFFCLFIAVLGQIVGRIEKWSRFDAFYWAFITALTVGYGDIRPLKRISKKFAITIAIAGIMFTGILVALTVHSAEMAFATQDRGQQILQGKGLFQG